MRPAYNTIGESPSSSLSTMKAILMVFLPSLVAFVLMDLVWISQVASPMFQEILGSLLRTPPEPFSGLLAWVLIVGGAYHFAARTAESATTAAVNGAILGLVIYGTYELTNYCVINAWTLSVTAADMAWGSFATATAAGLQYQLMCWAAKSSRQ